jgi:hypothetical protein
MNAQEMKMFNKFALFAMAFAIAFSSPKLEAVTYVTDTGGYAYDESRAATNLAPAIALSTVAIVGIIAIAVQNSHDHGSSSSSSHAHFSSSCGCCSGSYCH